MRNLVLGLIFLILLGAADQSPIRYVEKTKYLNNLYVIVSHTIDDSTKYVTNCLDSMDKYGIKATIFISTEQDPAPEDRFLTQLQVIAGPVAEAAASDRQRSRKSARTPASTLASGPIPSPGARKLITITKSPDRETISSA